MDDPAACPTCGKYVPSGDSWFIHQEGHRYLNADPVLLTAAKPVLNAGEIAPPPLQEPVHFHPPPPPPPEQPVHFHPQPPPLNLPHLQLEADVQCPLCSRLFSSGKRFESHWNYRHGEVVQRR